MRQESPAPSQEVAPPLADCFPDTFDIPLEDAPEATVAVAEDKGDVTKAVAEIAVEEFTRCSSGRTRFRTVAVT